ncbi:uncharacterized protein LOC121728989 [Aricia agestis]|uniref:uncharacterized protein LOC121728989 n=1 Tax=Aricia agestis TaxID=91739 RepID=UPI001C209D90|nr:uncharacterized protein LOC121728989 [Aricia agestis]
MAQWSIDLAFLSEPYRILSRSDWIGDADATVALVLGPRMSPPSSGRTTRGRGFVVSRLGALTVVGVYFSPNRPLAEFEAFLLRLTAFISGAPGPAIVAGDLNAKSTLWGSPATDARGRVVESWMASTGLMVANRGTVNTCVRRQGGSIVDVTLVSTDYARRITNWRVEEETETLSDHKFIRFDVRAHASELGRTISSASKKRRRRGAPSDKARPHEPGAGGAGVSQPRPAMEVEQ